MGAYCQGMENVKTINTNKNTMSTPTHKNDELINSDLLAFVNSL